MELYNIFEQCSGVTTDSRKVGAGELFFALHGANFNGNLYAIKALEAGAAEASKVGNVKCCEVIARPHPDVMRYLTTG